MAAPSFAVMPPPVIRASQAVQQTPPCYVKMANSQLQSLMDVCLMGKDLSRSRMFDLQTDRNGDGVPDELAAFFDRYYPSLNQMPIDGSPEQMRLLAAKQREMMQELARRLPINQTAQQALNEMGEMIYQMTSQDPNQLPSRERSRQTAQRMEEIGEILDRDPVLQKFQDYASRYERNLP